MPAFPNRPPQSRASPIMAYSLAPSGAAIVAAVEGYGEDGRLLLVGELGKNGIRRLLAAALGQMEKCACTGIECKRHFYRI